MAEKVRIGIHQPNFIPWLPYFHKMSKCNIFVLLCHVQFEKNNFQNRYQLSNGKWVTKPVFAGLDPIRDKNYVGLELPDETLSCGSLVELNTRWIKVIADTLHIKTKIVDDALGHETRSNDSTQRLADIILQYTPFGCIPVYVTNPNAKDKYLNENLLTSQGIEIEYCKCPKDMNIHVFEAFEKWGIEGTIKQLKR